MCEAEMVQPKVAMRSKASTVMYDKMTMMPKTDRHIGVSVTMSILLRRLDRVVAGRPAQEAETKVAGDPAHGRQIEGWL